MVVKESSGTSNSMYGRKENNQQIGIGDRKVDRDKDGLMRKMAERLRDFIKHVEAKSAPLRCKEENLCHSRSEIQSKAPTEERD